MILLLKITARPPPRPEERGLQMYLKLVGVAWFKANKSPACCQVSVTKSRSIILSRIHSCSTGDSLERERTFKSAEEVPGAVGGRERRLHKLAVRHAS